MQQIRTTPAGVKRWAAGGFLALTVIAITSCGASSETLDTTAGASAGGGAVASARLPDSASADVVSSAPAATEVLTSGPESTPVSKAAAPTGAAPTEAMPTGAGSSTAAQSEPRPAWHNTILTDIDGQTFSIAALAGKPVFVEFFATWCPTCRDQLGKTNDAAGRAGDGAIFLALSVETDLASTDVQAYRTDNQFTGLRFAILTPQMLAEVVEALGNTAINPPSTPHLVVTADGATGQLVTGAEDPDAILASMGLV